jgi:hypothetical protein
MATHKGKASVKGKVTVTASAAIAKHNDKLRASQSRPMNTDKGAHSLWADIARVAKGKVIPTDLREPLRENAPARRQWCADNGAVMVTVSDICQTNGARPDNAIRNRIETLRGVLADARKVWYVRALDNASVKRDPSHPLADKVYLYRVK